MADESTLPGPVRAMAVEQVKAAIQTPGTEFYDQFHALSLDKREWLLEHIGEIVELFMTGDIDGIRVLIGRDWPVEEVEEFDRMLLAQSLG